MAIHVHRHTQIVEAPLFTCWEFFSNPHNLTLLTPPSLNLTVVGQSPAQMYPGLMIQYRVRPLFGIPLAWLTEITHVDEQRLFVDEQRVGPYRIWHHEHHFRPLDEKRTEMRDVIHYVLKGAPFADLLHPLLVAPRLAEIFEFRQRATEEVFTAASPTDPASV